MIKTRDTRFKNRIMQRLADHEAGRFRFVPKSTALMDHCKNRNYGTNRTNENMRREMQQGEPHLFKPEDYA